MTNSYPLKRTPPPPNTAWFQLLHHRQTQLALTAQPINPTPGTSQHARSECDSALPEQPPQTAKQPKQANPARRPHNRHSTPRTAQPSHKCKQLGSEGDSSSTVLKTGCGTGRRRSGSETSGGRRHSVDKPSTTSPDPWIVVTRPRLAL